MTFESFKTSLYNFGQVAKRKKSLNEVQDELNGGNELPTTPIVNNDGNNNIEVVNQEGGLESGQKNFKKCLTVYDLLALGVGGIIGAGIFVMTGVAAHDKAGPAVTISYLISAFACALSGLCYAEFACKVPCSGSTYSYSYIVVGELVAWIIGWDLTLEYMIASAAVSRGWSAYLKSIIEASGGYLPHPFNPIHLGGGFSVDIIAALSIIMLTLVIAFGMKESARFNKLFVIVKIVIVIFVIIVGSRYANSDNWSNYTPYGVKGIFNAAAITFFAYLGFDGVCNVAEEVKNPQRDLPIGILGSLGISTVLYVGVTIVLTLMVPYQLIDVNAPLSKAFENVGLKWAQIIVAIGAFAGLTTAQLSGLISQPRLYYSLSRDGLLPKWMSYIHPKYKTPFYSTLFTGGVCAIIGLFVEIEVLGDMVSIGTLLAFSLVSTCVLVLRYPTPTSNLESNSKYPVNKFPLFLQNPLYLMIFIAISSLIASAGYVKSLHWVVILIFGLITLIFIIILCFLKEHNIPGRGFKVPLVPYLPILSIIINTYLMVSLSWETWVRLIVWLIIGLGIYIFYGRKHSKLNNKHPNETELSIPKNDQFTTPGLTNSNNTNSGNSSNSSSNEYTTKDDLLKENEKEKNQTLENKNEVELVKSPNSGKSKSTPKGVYNELDSKEEMTPIVLNDTENNDSENK